MILSHSLPGLGFRFGCSALTKRGRGAVSCVPAQEPDPSKDAAREGVSSKGRKGQAGLQNYKLSLLGQVPSERSTTKDQ